MHVMKILYMASIYGLVTEKKKFIAVFMKNRCKIILKKKFTAVFMEKSLQKPFYSGFYLKNRCKRSCLQRFLVKNHCKIIFYSGLLYKNRCKHFAAVFNKTVVKFYSAPNTK
jgi:hypothetical protein